jgi:hypothetical protein
VIKVKADNYCDGTTNRSELSTTILVRPCVRRIVITVIDTCYIIIFIELSINLLGKIVSNTSRKLVLVNSSTSDAPVVVLDIFLPTIKRYDLILCLPKSAKTKE